MAHVPLSLPSPSHSLTQYDPAVHRVGFFNNKPAPPPAPEAGDGEVVDAPPPVHHPTPAEYLPAKVLADVELAELERRIFDLMGRWAPENKTRAMQLYVEHASSLLCFGLTAYEARTTGDRPVTLGVIEDGLVVFFEKAPEPAYFDFGRLGRWEVVDNGIVVPCNESPYTFVMSRYAAAQMAEQLTAYHMYWVLSKFNMIPSPVRAWLCACVRVA